MATRQRQDHCHEVGEGDEATATVSSVAVQKWGKENGQLELEKFFYNKITPGHLQRGPVQGHCQCRILQRSPRSRDETRDGPSSSPTRMSTRPCPPRVPGESDSSSQSGVCVRSQLGDLLGW